MKEKKWLRQYGVHIVICVVVLTITFGVNQKINLNRYHTYSVSEGVYTLLKGITKAEVNGNQLEIAGWGFDTEIYNESSNCELILQETETGEALWVRMEKEPVVVEIAERYTDGRDYSGASFAGSLKASQLDEECVYEILIRYTTDYLDENGKEQQYVRTVSTDEFLYNGEITEYNPKTFVAPEIAGTELERELEGARLFHWFEEGMWVYYTEEKLYYIAKKEWLKEQSICTMRWSEKRRENLPEIRLEDNWGTGDFYFEKNERLYSNNNAYKVAVQELPSDEILCMRIGLYHKDDSWLFEKGKQLQE